MPRKPRGAAYKNRQGYDARSNKLHRNLFKARNRGDEEKINKYLNKIAQLRKENPVHATPMKQRIDTDRGPAAIQPNPVPSAKPTYESTNGYVGSNVSPSNPSVVYSATHRRHLHIEAQPGFEIDETGGAGLRGPDIDEPFNMTSPFRNWRLRPTEPGRLRIHRGEVVQQANPFDLLRRQLPYQTHCIQPITGTNVEVKMPLPQLGHQASMPLGDHGSIITHNHQKSFPNPPSRITSLGSGARPNGKLRWNYLHFYPK